MPRIPSTIPQNFTGQHGLTVTVGDSNNAMSFTKQQVIETIAQKTGAEKRTVEAILDSMAQLAYQNAKDEFTVPGIGKLIVVDRKARTARNPKTGAQVQVPAKKALKFRISKVAKDAVLGATTLPTTNTSTVSDPVTG